MTKRRAAARTAKSPVTRRRAAARIDESPWLPRWTLWLSVVGFMVFGASIALLVAGNDHTITKFVGPVTDAIAAISLVAALGPFVLERWERLSWDARPYRVADRPAVRYETRRGHYIKFERYDDGISANWSTVDGPQVLLSIPLRGHAVGQFWTSEAESDPCSLTQLAPDLRRNKSDVIRAWVETDRELIVWRLADPGAAGIAQLGVLMRSWSPARVKELVSASATKPVQGEVSKWLEDAGTLML